MELYLLPCCISALVARYYLHKGFMPCAHIFECMSTLLWDSTIATWYIFHACQVSSIRKSSSDDKKFYIFTGTKTLHLRTENIQDRREWLEALFAAKEYVQGSAAKQVSLPAFQTDVSTKMLRRRLLQEGLAENVIVDCEEILRSEFSLLLKHLKILEESHFNLLERLNQLEVWVSRISLGASYMHWSIASSLQPLKHFA